MIVKYLQEAVLLTVISTCLIIYLSYLITSRKKSVKKSIDTHLFNKRLLEFRPEPIIDVAHVDAIRNKVIEIPQPDEASLNCLNLAKINYLNLLNNDEIKQIADDCIRSYGVGSCGPRGFYGTIDVHLNLENRLATFMGMEETVLYSYGFSTIASAIGAYCKRSDIIFCDEYISFAGLQGIQAAKSTVVYFKHNDMDDLESKLKDYTVKEIARKKPYRKFLIVEGIYKKTGSICPLPKLMELRKQYKLRIFIDESISFGVLGKTGRGITEHYNIDRSNVDMIIGSLEGAVGSIGGFCVGASVVIEHQRLSGLGYCFSASLPPFLSSISIGALNIFERDPLMFENLQSKSIQMDTKLQGLTKYAIISNPLSPLKVLEVNDMDSKVLHSIFEYCSRENVYLAKEDNRLSLNINIAMTEEQMDRVVQILEESSKCIT